MTTRVLSVSSYLLAVCAIASAANLPYIGKWKMNPAKSDFGESTITYAQLPSGEMQCTVDGQSYKFKLDGKDYPDPFGNTAAWKAVDATTWQTTWKLKGKVLSVDTVKVSADGQSLTVNSQGTKPTGGSFDDTSILRRVSGGPGLAGRWKMKNMKASSPNVLEISASGADRLVYRVIDMNMVCDAKIDGKYYPCSGPTLGTGWRLAWQNASASGLDWSVQMNGRPMFNGQFTVSTDGKTLTDDSHAAMTNEKVKIVYDRQ